MNIAESLPSALQQALHRDQRAERVAVGVLVGGEHEARSSRDPLEHLLAGARARRLAHPAPISSISSSTRSARSMVSS